MQPLEFGKILLKAAGEPGFADALERMKASGLLAECLPEIACMDAFLHDPQFHPEGSVRGADGTIERYGTVWDHTLAVVRDYGGTDPEINLGCLFHDIGKPVCAGHKRSPVFHSFPGHENAGQAPMRAVAQRLGFSAELTDRLVYVIAKHMTICRFPEMKPAKILTIVRDPRWPLLREVSLHDDRSRAPAFDPDNWTHYDNIIRIVTDNDEAPIPYRVNGFYAMHVTGLMPGEKLGRVIELASRRVRENPALKDSLEAVVRAAYLEVVG